MKTCARRILGAAAVSILCAGMFAAAWAGNGPRIEVAPNRADLGTVKQGDLAVQVFELRNAGDAPLVIHKIETS